LYISLYYTSLTDTLKKIEEVFKNKEYKLSNIDYKKKQIFVSYNNIKCMFVWEREIVMKYRNRGYGKIKREMNFCYSLHKFWAIDLDGDVNTCCDVYKTIPFHKEHIIGNLNEIDAETMYKLTLLKSTKNLSSCNFCNAPYYQELPFRGMKYEL
jgi:hypothetical protein